MFQNNFMLITSQFVPKYVFLHVNYNKSICSRKDYLEMHHTYCVIRNSEVHLKSHICLSLVPCVYCVSAVGQFGPLFWWIFKCLSSHKRAAVPPMMPQITTELTVASPGHVSMAITNSRLKTRSHDINRCTSYKGSGM